MVLVAASGPVMNIALALVAALAFHIVGYLPGTSAEWLADNLRRRHSQCGARGVQFISGAASGWRSA